MEWNEALGNETKQVGVESTKCKYGTAHVDMKRNIFEWNETIGNDKKQIGKKKKKNGKKCNV